MFLSMKPRFLLFTFLTVTASLSQAFAQNYDTNNPVVQTFVGSGFYGYLDGQGTQTMFNNPSAVVADSSSNLFVLDNSNYRIRKVTPDGTVSTFAGGGSGAIPGYGTNVSLSPYTFSSYTTMAIDHSNALWINAINGSAYLLRIGSDGYISSSNPGLSSPGGIAVDSANNLYISDYGTDKIYRLRTNGALEVFVGSGNSGYVDGNGIFTSFAYPSGWILQNYQYAGGARRHPQNTRRERSHDFPGHAARNPKGYFSNHRCGPCHCCRQRKRRIRRQYPNRRYHLLFCEWHWKLFWPVRP